MHFGCEEQDKTPHYNTTHVHDRSADVLRAVDDLFDARDTERDVHTGNPGEMEGLQRHLCARLADGLSPESAHLRRAEPIASSRNNIDSRTSRESGNIGGASIYTHTHTHTHIQKLTYKH